jgi:hypothetical protein
MSVDAGVPADAARLPERHAAARVAGLDVGRHHVEMVGLPLD